MGIPFPESPLRNGNHDRVKSLESLMATVQTLQLKPITVHWYDRVWAWMSGKKSITGIAMMFGGAALCLGPGTQVGGYKMLGEGVFALGSTLAGAGLAHKIQKANDPGAGQTVKGDWLSLVLMILKKILEFLSKT